MQPHRHRRISLCLAAAVLILCPPRPLDPAAAAANGKPQTPRREQSPGLFVDFTAIQDDGTPLEALQPSDVEIRLDGRTRAVRAIRRIASGLSPAAPGLPPRMAPPYGTNQDVTTGRSFVLLLDEESLAAGRETQLRSAVEGLLAEFGPADRAMVLALPYGGVRQAFTSDTARLRLAIAGGGRGPQRESGSDMACRTRRFLEALHGFLLEQSGRVAPLTVVLFTAGLAAPRRDAPMARAPGMCELPVSHFQMLSAAAGAARANFYVLQPSDIGFNASGWTESIAGTAFLGSDNPLEGIEHLAGATGATRLSLDATGTASLVRVARESSAYFVAELASDPRDALGRSRKLAVRAMRPGTTVRARPEISFPEPARPSARRLAVGDLLASAEAAPDLPLRVGGFTVRESGGRLRVGAVIEPAEPDVVLASAGAVLLASGEVAARWFASDASEHPLLGAMAAAPGRYRLRAAAIDQSGRAGVAEEDLDVRLVSAGPLLLGSLVLGVSREGGVVPRLEFAAEPAVIASFDIYSGEAGIALRAALEVARGPDEPALVTLPLTLARADAGRVVATGSVPLGALPPGDYVVRGVIRLEDGTAGVVSRTLRKAGG